MSKVFISYRRADTEDVVGRLCDHLSRGFGKRNVYHDVDSIPLAVDFREHIVESLGQCSAVVAVVGPSWETLTDDNGIRRIESSDDFVRIELETAIKHDIPVFWVLTGGAEMPSLKSVPDSLRPLVFSNALNLRSDPYFVDDVKVLSREIRRLPRRRGLSIQPVDWVGALKRPSMFLCLALGCGLVPIWAARLISLIPLFETRWPMLTPESAFSICLGAAVVLLGFACIALASVHPYANTPRAHIFYQLEVLAAWTLWFLGTCIAMMDDEFGEFAIVGWIGSLLAGLTTMLIRAKIARPAKSGKNHPR